ncbi:MAG: NAD+ synthase [Candidatus Bipolaricaulota bacterium]|nr:NAD+ synthase [Candidatus Bipolaricaulota bacterium]
MRLGLAQIDPTVGAIDDNLSLILSHIERAKRSECDLVIFPELAVCGYAPLDLLWRRGFLDKMQEAQEKIRQASSGIGVIVGGITAQQHHDRENLADQSSICDGAGTDLFNTALFFSDASLVASVPKLNLPTFDVYSERRYFTPGPGAQVVDFHGKPIGINVCEDLWVDGGPTDAQASLGAEWIINISASPFFVGNAEVRRHLAARRARENGITLFCTNLIGGQDDIIFDGGSFITGPNGDLLYQAPSFVEGLFIFDTEQASPAITPKQDDITTARKAIILGIRDYLRKNSFSRVIIGISGGIDSALVAALAVEALGRDAVSGVFLPSDISSQESHDDAHALARNLGIDIIDVPISKVVSSSHIALQQAITGLAAENLQARVRGMLLMALANEHNALILTTGNKSEIAVGYNTLYGDTVGALAPIADLYKTQVRTMAQGMDGLIPQRIIDKPPTAELRPNQKDEDDLPPYPILDAILEQLIEKNASRNDLVTHGFPEATVDDVFARYYRNEYKRHQLPLAIKVSAKAFGSGRRVPITHRYRS